jgi:hypothetical protein
MATYPYTVDPVDPAVLAKEIEAALPGQVFSLHKDGTGITIEVPSSLSSGDETTLGAAVAAHDPTVSLPDYKTAAKVSVDELIHKYVTGIYPKDDCCRLSIILADANRTGKTNRAAHVGQLNTWVESVWGYYTTKAALIDAAANEAAVDTVLAACTLAALATAYDGSDPGISIPSAYAIAD